MESMKKAWRHKTTLNGDILFTWGSKYNLCSSCRCIQENYVDYVDYLKYYDYNCVAYIEDED